jgi:hypothetical protein
VKSVTILRFLIFDETQKGEAKTLLRPYTFYMVAIWHIGGYINQTNRMPTPDMDLQIVDQFASQLASRNNLQTGEAVLKS